MGLWCFGSAPSSASYVLDHVVVTAERLRPIGTAATASEGVVVNDELALLPVYRPGQLLETVPGLVVTLHSGEGKANQYLLRGYNLDHGTDLAVFIDGIPVNEPSHAHGQGYADLNFLIPSLRPISITPRAPIMPGKATLRPSGPYTSTTSTRFPIRSR